jgi:hypothetical protein
MTIRSCIGPFMGLGWLVLSGCDVMQSARNDLGRLGSVRWSTPPSQSSTSTATAPRSSARLASTASAARSSPAGAPQSPPSPVDLTGKSESEVRALLGAPTSVEDRPPGKTWRYQDGQCSVDVQFYPDVKTKQFDTLAYEVRSDDNTDEGKRRCMAHLQSRT